jgi:hypothetical protein
MFKIGKGQKQLTSPVYFHQISLKSWVKTTYVARETCMLFTLKFLI